MQTYAESLFLSTRANAAKEKRRLAAIKALPNANAATLSHFDRITRWASHRWTCPIALIALVGESTVVFKSASGVEEREVQRHGSLFEYTIRNHQPTIVSDIRRNTNFAGHRFVQTENICSYAAAPIRTLDGYQLGAICIMDRAPRRFTNEHTEELERLAALAADEIEAPGYNAYANHLGFDLLSAEDAYITCAA